MNDKFLVKKGIGARVAEGVFGAIFPNKCLFCDIVLMDARAEICDGCVKMFHVEHFGGYAEIEEISCVYGAFEYTDGPRDAIFQLKYEGRKMLARQIAGLIHKRIGRVGGNFLLAPPLHEKRERERGFNQANLLALELAILMELPAYDGLTRRKETAPQFEMNVEERKANITGAFEVKGGFDVRGADILLVDDVLTTGATAGECAAVLKRAGANSVSLIVFAVAALHSEQK